eukprot:scaffold207_cov409-Prasinococcus_capsulatus_cf.AAC.14
MASTILAVLLAMGSAQAASSEVAFSSLELLQNNLGGMGPRAGPDVLKFANLGTVNGEQVSLVVSNSTEYIPAVAARNGLHGGFGSINVANGHQTKFIFQFVNDVGNPIILERLLFSFFDIDGAADGVASESLGIKGYTSYFVTPTTTLNISESTAPSILSNFSSTRQSGVKDNPKDPNTLNQAQRDKSVSFLFHDVSEFGVWLTTGGQNGRNRGGRDFLFAITPSVASSAAIHSTSSSPPPPPPPPPPTAPPTPLPPAAWAPSEPHLVGLHGQRFDFTGEVGRYYCLLSDFTMILNAKLDTAYTARSFIDGPNSGRQQEVSDGTWMTEAGFIFVEPDKSFQTLRHTTVVISFTRPEWASDSDVAAHRAVVQDGFVSYNGQLLSNELTTSDTGMTLQVWSTNRRRSVVDLVIPEAIRCTFTLVPPPSEWNIEAEQRAMYSHINMNLHEVTLSPMAHGVLGSTQRLNMDVNGEPVMEGYDRDGAGVIEGVASDYEVSSLLSRDFQYSVTPQAIIREVST